MFARKLLTGSVVSAVALSVVALSAGVASAAYTSDPADVVPVSPVSADIFGSGSDTTQDVMHDLAIAYNATNPTTGRLATYSALGGGTLPLPGVAGSAEPNRPINSGQGRALLFGSNAQAEMDFARSSGAIPQTEIDAGLVMFPFARDGVQMAVRNPSTYAPASITGAQIVSIYTCKTTDWASIPGGTAGKITPLIPPTSSGTYSFFIGQLTQFNGGQPVVPDPSCVKTVQEHDPAPFQDNTTYPGAVGPFSLAKASKLTNVKLLGGFAPTRPVYNVLRGAQASAASLQAVFGANGYLCSPAGKAVIEAAGFRQLLPVNKGGVCGAQTTTAPSNTLVDQVQTSTQVSVTSASASSARTVAKVVPADPSTTPTGTVTFFEGSAVVAANVPLASGGQATVSPAAAPGVHSYRAVFTPAANSAFITSEGTGSGTVSRASSSLTESFPAKAKSKVKTVKGKKKTIVKALKGAVTVNLVGSSTKGSGTILVKKGSKTVGTGSLSNGSASFALNGLKPGTNKLTATWGGDANSAGSNLSFTVKVAKAKKKK